MKRWGVLMMLITCPAYADSSSMALQLPSPQGNYAQDAFRAGDKDCKNAIGGSINFEFGVLGAINNVGGSYDYQSQNFKDQSKDVGVFARMVIPLNGPKERINCNTLYQLELQQRRLEIQKLQTEIQQLKAITRELKFEK